MADDAATPSGELSKPASEPAEPLADSVESDESAAEFLGEDENDGEDYPELDAQDTAPRMSHVRLATIVGLVVVLALGGLVGWLSFRAYQSHQLDTQRKVFLQVGRQGALNL